MNTNLKRGTKMNKKETRTPYTAEQIFMTRLLYSKAVTLTISTENVKKKSPSDKQ